MRKIGVFVAAMLLAAAARSAPPDWVDPRDDSPMALWYHSLMSPDVGGSCCSIADCRPVEARQVDGHWEVLTESGWLTVLTQRVLHRENLDGRPIACQILGEIRCFVPPAGT